MVPLFDNIAVFHYQYKICISDGGESVGDYEAGSAFHEVIHGFWIWTSVLVSTELVASSRIRIFGSARMALAIVRSCF